MRATELISELFQPGKTNWEWARLGRDEASAFFKIGGREYLWQAFVGSNPKKWEIQFRLIRKPDVDPDELDLFGTTGTGNSAEVMSTAVDITRAFLKEYGLDNVEEITFNAKEDSRIGLYAKMIKRLLPNWDLYSKKDPYDGMVFTLTDRRAYDKPENKLSEDKRIARYNGLIMGYAFNNTGLKIKAYDPVTRTPIAFAEFVKEDKELYPQMLWVHDDYRNKGIAKSMYDFLKDDGYEINRSHDQTNAGAKFWDKHRGEDAYVWEDMTRRGFLGGLAGMAAAAAGVDAEAGTKKPKIKSPSQQTIQQVQKQQAVKPASPTKNPQAEAMLYRTARASGMKGSELAQFLAQTKHESWDHSRLQEKPVGDPNRYFAKKYDPTLAPKTAKILGNKNRGDGAKYYGRGFIQLTGRDNYRMASEALGLDLINRPDLASNPEVAAKIAVWYWNTRVKPKVQNFDDTVAVTKTINNAMFGLEDRLANYIDYKKRVA